MLKLKSCLHVFVFTILFSVAIVASASASIYKYVAPDGTIHFTNTPTTNNYEVYRSIGSDWSMTELINHYAVKYRLELTVRDATGEVGKAGQTQDSPAVTGDGKMRFVR